MSRKETLEEMMARVSNEELYGINSPPPIPAPIPAPALPRQSAPYVPHPSPFEGHDYISAQTAPPRSINGNPFEELKNRFPVPPSLFNVPRSNVSAAPAAPAPPRQAALFATPNIVHFHNGPEEPLPPQPGFTRHTGVNPQTNEEMLDESFIDLPTVGVGRGLTSRYLLSQSKRRKYLM
jgi:hypothetical protein